MSKNQKGLQTEKMKLILLMVIKCLLRSDTSVSVFLLKVGVGAILSSVLSPGLFGVGGNCPEKFPGAQNC